MDKTKGDIEEKLVSQTKDTAMTKGTALSARTHQRRLRRARHFRALTILAVAMALALLGFLLTSIGVKSWEGFSEAQVRLTIPLNIPLAVPATAPPTTSPTAPPTTTADQPASATAIPGQALADPFALLKAGWQQRFGEANSSRRSLQNIFSRTAEEHIAQAQSQAGNQPAITLWLPANQHIKRYLHNPSDPGLADLLSPHQLKCLAELQAAGDLRRSMSVDFWNQPDARSPEAAGIAGALLGSLMTILVTLAAALPLGLMAALYLEELAPRQHRLTRAWWRLVEVVTINLAATPSVVFGLLGLTVFLHLMHLPRSAPLVGGLVLALMALPLIIIAARNAIRTVPVEQRDAALALGASPMQVTLHHVLPAAFPGMITGAVLALAHVLGETAPLMLIGMVAFIASYPTSWLQPATTLPIQIYLWATSPEPAFASKAAAGVVVLLVLVLSLNALAQTARRRWKHRW